MNKKVRKLLSNEVHLLREFLFLSIHVPAGAAAPDPKIIDSEPSLRSYFEDWGRTDDCAFVFDIENVGIVGIAWVRQMTTDSPGYGFIDSKTLSLAVSVKPNYRGIGIGTLLLKELFESVKHKNVCLSVAKGNPAVSLYRRLGFKRFSLMEDEEVMLRHG